MQRFMTIQLQFEQHISFRSASSANICPKLVNGDNMNLMVNLLNVYRLPDGIKTRLALSNRQA